MNDTQSNAKNLTPDDDGAKTTLYCARWALPDARRVIDDGAVAVRGSQIVGVNRRAELVARYPRATVRDYGRAAILPGFVNAHSHLELTLMRNFLEGEEPDFFRWLRKLTQTKYERLTVEDMRDAAMWGAIEAVRGGVTCVGDASDYGAASIDALTAIGLRGIVYQELFGVDANVAREQLAALQEKIAALREQETSLVRAGVSPHAPYTVSAPLLEHVSDYAVSHRLPLMMHAAESRAESLLLRDGTGAFAASLAQRGIAWHAPGVSPIQHLAAHGILAAAPLLAHCIRVDDADIELLARSNARVAHCPKSNLKLGHGRAPFARLLQHGVAVGFGSDSVASNNTCDLLEEARFALLLARLDTDDEPERASVSVADALYAATTGGAQALGLASHTGTLDEGFAADLAIVDLNGAHQTPVHEPLSALVFASSARDVAATIIAGREVFVDGRVMTVDEARARARMLEIESKLAG